MNGEPSAHLERGSWWLFAFAFVVIFAGMHWNLFGVADVARFHNFDLPSESLVVGRFVQLRHDGVASHGGLTGYGSPETPIPYGGKLFQYEYDSYYSDRPFQQYVPYASTIGGQATMLGLVDSVLPGAPGQRIQLLHLLMAGLSAIALALVVRWFFVEFGLAAALAVLSSIAASAWLTLFGHSLYTTLWAFFLPILGVMCFYRKPRGTGKRRALALAATIVGCVFAKCVFNGYELITTTLVMMVTPLVYGHLRDGLSRQFAVDLAIAVGASCVAIALSMAVLFGQIAIEDGGFARGWDHIAWAFERRTRTIGPPVIGRYLGAVYTDLTVRLSHSFGGWLDTNVLRLRYWVIAVAFAVGSLAAWVGTRSATRSAHRRPIRALVGTVWFSALAPLSWFLLFRSHSDQHFHVVPLAWQMPFTLFGAALLGVTGAGLLRRCMGSKTGPLVGAGLLASLTGLLVFLPGYSSGHHRLLIPYDFPTIQAAVEHAGKGTWIVVKPGTYRGPIDLGDGNLRLVSSDGPERTTLIADGDAFAVTVGGTAKGPARIEGFTIRATNGIVSRAPAIRVKNNVLLGNGGSGVGIRAEGDVVVTESSIDGFGALGVSCRGTAALIRFNTIRRNGSGIELETDRFMVRGNRILDNRSTPGGGVQVMGGSGTLEGNLVTGNEGGGLSIRDASVRLDHNTIAHNTTAQNGATRGAGISIERSKAVVVNSIVWMNGASAEDEIRVADASVEPSHSLIRGGRPGPSIAGDDPRFVAPSSGDFDLAVDSPGRNRGAPTPHSAAGRTPPADLGAKRLYYVRSFEHSDTAATRTLEFVALGPPGQRVALASAGAAASIPDRSRDRGVCHLKRRSLRVRPEVTIPISGAVRLQLDVPSASSASDVFVQARVGGRWSNLLIVPAGP